MAEQDYGWMLGYAPAPQDVQAQMQGASWSEAQFAPGGQYAWMLSDPRFSQYLSSGYVPQMLENPNSPGSFLPGFIQGDVSPSGQGMSKVFLDGSGNVVNQTYDAPGMSQMDRFWRQQLPIGLGVVGAGALAGGLGAGAAGAVGSGGTGAAASPLLAGTDAALLSEIGGAGSFGAGGLGAGTAGAVGAAGMAGGVGAAGTGAAGAGGLLGQAGSALGSAGSSLLSNPGLLAAGLGAVAGVAGNGDLTSSQNTSSTGNASQSLAPWLQPYAQQYVGQAANLAGGPTSNATLDQARAMLMAQNPTVAAGAQQQQDVIGGKYLNSNPYIDQVASNIGQRMGDAYAVGTRAGMLGAGNANGGYNAGAQQAVGMADRNFADSLGATMSNLYYGNYANERAAQNSAAQGSTAFGNYGLNQATTLGNFGQADWLRPFQANQYLGQAINPSFGSQSNTSSTGNTSMNMTGPSDWMAGIGGGLAGLSIYNQMFGKK